MSEEISRLNAWIEAEVERRVSERIEAEVTKRHDNSRAELLALCRQCLDLCKEVNKPLHR